MDHRRLIHNIFSKYADAPEVLADIKRCMKYMESHHRMFAIAVIREESATNSIVEIIDERAEASTSSVEFHV